MHFVAWAIAAFDDAVRDHAGACVDRRDRGVVDDRPAAVVLHVTRRALGPDDHAEQVDVDDPRGSPRDRRTGSASDALPMPALLNMMCSPPKWSTARSTSAWTSLGVADVGLAGTRRRHRAMRRRAHPRRCRRRRSRRSRPPRPAVRRSPCRCCRNHRSRWPPSRRTPFRRARGLRFQLSPCSNCIRLLRDRSDRFGRLEIGLSPEGSVVLMGRCSRRTAPPKGIACVSST